MGRFALNATKAFGGQFVRQPRRRRGNTAPSFARNRLPTLGSVRMTVAQALPGLRSCLSTAQGLRTSHDGVAQASPVHPALPVKNGILVALANRSGADVVRIAVNGTIPHMLIESLSR